MTALEAWVEGKPILLEYRDGRVSETKKGGTELEKRAWGKGGVIKCWIL